MSTTLTDRRAREKVPAERATRESPLKWYLYLFGGVGAALVFAVPLFFALVRSLQPNEVIVEAPDIATFFQWNLDNFRELAAQSELGRSVINSLVVSLSTAGLTAFLATLAGYGFAKFSFRMRPWLFGAVLLTMMVPFQAILTPLYLQLNIMGLTDSLLGLILFYTTVNLPFCVFVMRNSFAAIPDELEAAAHVDGAGTVRMVAFVLRPLILPGAATAALYAFLASWTEFLAALTFLTDQDLYTLPVSMVNLQQGAYGEVNFGLIASGAVVAMVPCAILYIALQRFYVAGLASGSVKA